MVLKQYLRGSLLMLFAFTTLSLIVTEALRKALAIVDQISSGEIPVDAGAISDLVSASTTGAEGSIMNIAGLAFGVCWLIGIIDSYRLGNKREEHSS